jgi:hypothetical protein
MSSNRSAKWRSLPVGQRAMALLPEWPVVPSLLFAVKAFAGAQVTTPAVLGHHPVALDSLGRTFTKEIGNRV